MRTLTRILLPAALAVIAGCGGVQNRKAPAMQHDKAGNELVERLFETVKAGKILYGHQDDLSYGHAWRVTDPETDSLTRSDVREVSGHYPAVVGFDLGGIETGDDKNLDSVSFTLMRRAALTHVARGGVVTFSWHPRNPLTGGDAWDISSDKVVGSILPGGEKYGEFRRWLTRVGDFFESLQTPEGERIPFIFRPWHEHTGSWFWWGEDLCTRDQYRELFRMTWLYLAKDRGLENILWCYSPGAGVEPEGYMERYPGDEFIDLLGLDCYEYIGKDGIEEAGVAFSEQVKGSLTFMNALGVEHGKLICLSETGLESLVDPEWWTGVLYPAIKDYPVCYVLTWRNACDKPMHFYAPWKGFEHEDDFVQFSQMEQITLL